ncbi:MAG: glycosyltransferase family 39 protein [Anaerolineales bacterium]|nr:glycosyltransferase family 39 protein [Anaerolineales bacterium]
MRKEKLRKSLVEVGGLLVLAAILLVPRAKMLGQYTFIDEAYYLKHGARFYWAVANQEYEGTDLVVHPGVTTNWLGAAAFFKVYPEFAEEYGELEIPDLILRRMLKGQDLSLNYVLIFARRNVVLFNAIFLLVAYLLARRLFPIWLALPGMILAGFSPFYFEHSRFLFVDGILSTLMLASLLAMLVYLKENRIGWLLFSAVLGGLSVLTKVPGLMLVGFLGLFGLIEWLGSRSEIFWPPRSWGGMGKLVGAVLLWLLVALAVIALFWPAMWQAPWEKLGRIASFVLDQGGADLISPMFFNGEINPSGVFGWEYASYYLITYLWRGSPVTQAGLLLLIAAYVLRKRVQLPEISWLVVGRLAVFGLGYILLMTLSVKKFDRYILPSLLPLNLMAAAGYYLWVRRLVELVTKPWKRQNLQHGLILLALLAIAGLQVLLVYRVFPYGLSYYNPFMGGTQSAVEVMMVGYGEGLDQAAEYLMTKPGKVDLVIYSFYSNAFGFHFDWQINEMPWYEWEFTDEVFDADYWVLYQSQKQRGMSGPAFEYVEGYQPEHVVVINGLEYAWVYNLAEIRAKKGD